MCICVWVGAQKCLWKPWHWLSLELKLHGCESWELNYGPLKDQKVLLITANLTNPCHGVSLLQYFTFLKMAFQIGLFSLQYSVFPQVELKRQ